MRRTLLAFLVSAVFTGGLQAQLAGNAVINSQSHGGGQYRYSLTINNTGTTNIGTLWFAWIPGANFLITNPVNIQSPSGWTPTITHGSASDGYGIRWVAGSGAAVTPGTSRTGFGFDSSDTPAQLAGNAPNAPTTPVTTSFFYIGAAFGDPGLRFVASVVPACRVDFDGNGTRNPTDIFAYLNAYFASNLAADWDGNGTLQPTDIFAFLNAYFAGCP